MRKWVTLVSEIHDFPQDRVEYPRRTEYWASQSMAPKTFNIMVVYSDPKKPYKSAKRKTEVIPVRASDAASARAAVKNSFKNYRIHFVDLAE